MNILIRKSLVSFYCGCVQSMDEAYLELRQKIERHIRFVSIGNPNWKECTFTLDYWLKLKLYRKPSGDVSVCIADDGPYEILPTIEELEQALAKLEN
jgi:hypothetical protein